jgi:hypothetical protein
LGALFFLKTTPPRGVLRESNPGQAPNRIGDGSTLASGSERLSDREARAATNQTRFRRLDGRVGRSGRVAGRDAPSGEWFCECANDTCTARIEMSIEEYEAVRRFDGRFFIAAGDEHFRPDIERVLEHNARYWVVEQAGSTAPAPREPAEPSSGKVPLRLHT